MAEKMKRLGLAALSQARYNLHFMDFHSEFESELGALQAAHTAEILIKARIAEEHPLLIFEKLPHSSSIDEQLLDFKHLFKNARTIQYSDLPERLWATTGIKLKDIDLYRQFGYLRNSIQHFAVPDSVDVSAIDFIYKLIDPFINDCWGLYAVDYLSSETETYEHLMEGLIESKIDFLISPNLAKEYDFESPYIKWPSNNYKQRVEKQLFQLKNKLN